MLDFDEGVLNKMEKGWAIATRCSEQRLKRVYEWTDAELGTAVKEGMVMLETVCVFVHGCIKSGQYKCAKATIPADVEIEADLLTFEILFVLGFQLIFGRFFMPSMASSFIRQP